LDRLSRVNARVIATRASAEAARLVAARIPRAR
jgi:hypothetical protein